MTYINGVWVYTDNGVAIDQEIRPCVRCGKMPTKDGHDACIGSLSGVSSVCCGHGVEEPYVVYEGEMH